MKRLMSRTILSIATMVVAIWLGVPAVSLARHQIEVESSYRGDGWFEYRLCSMDDPYFPGLVLGGLIQVPFTNHVEFGATPSSWFASLGTNRPPGDAGPYAEWGCVSLNDWTNQIRPFEIVFRARSAERHFKRYLGSYIVFSLSGGDGGSGSDNMIGLWTVPTLIPCSAEEADGAPMNLLTRIAFIDLPDVRITGLQREAARVRGISFDYSRKGTFQLQATRDFRAWTNIAYVFGGPGPTTWMSPDPLNNYGEYFRLLLAAEGHVDFSAGSTGKAVIMRNADAGKLLRCVPRGANIEVQVQTVSGLRYVVKVLLPSGQPQQQRVIEGRDGVSTVWLDAPPLGAGLVTLERLRE